MKLHWTLKLTIFFAAFAAAVGFNYSCAPDDRKAAAVLRANGFHDVRITDSHYLSVVLFGCDASDSVAHEATATNAAGERVKVLVCCGSVLKACTVRTP